MQNVQGHDVKHLKIDIRLQPLSEESKTVLGSHGIGDPMKQNMDMLPNRIHDPQSILFTACHTQSKINTKEMGKYGLLSRKR